MGDVSCPGQWFLVIHMSYKYRGGERDVELYGFWSTSPSVFDLWDDVDTPNVEIVMFVNGLDPAHSMSDIICCVLQTADINNQISETYD